MWKRTILIIFGILLFSYAMMSGIVFAELSCEVRNGTCQTGYADIMHLSGTTNAHAELSNQTAYTWNVCCKGTDTNEIITSTCSSVFYPFLYLSSQTNAHVQQGNNTQIYNISACISTNTQRLECFYGSSCDNYDTCLLTISNYTNAHAGNCTAYPIRVCCRSYYLQEYQPYQGSSGGTQTPSIIKPRIVNQTNITIGGNITEVEPILPTTGLVNYLNKQPVMQMLMGGLFFAELLPFSKSIFGISAIYSWMITIPLLVVVTFATTRKLFSKSSKKSKQGTSPS